jgi:hypothetical protein
MAEPALGRPGVVAFVGEGVAAGMAQHVRVGLELQLGDGGCPLDSDGGCRTGRTPAALLNQLGT